MATTVVVAQDPIEIKLSAVVDDDFTWTAFFEEELTPGVFTPITLTGNPVEAMIKKKEGDETALDEWNIVVDVPSVGWASFSLDDTETKALGKGSFFTSVRITRGTYTRTYLAGTLTLGRRATYD